MTIRSLSLLAALAVLVAATACRGGRRSENAPPASSTQPEAAQTAQPPGGDPSDGDRPAAADEAYRPVPRPPEPVRRDAGDEASQPPPKVHPRAGDDAPEDAPPAGVDGAAESAEPAPVEDAGTPVAEAAAVDGAAAASAEPDPSLVTLQAGTELEIELIDAVSTRDARAGQRVRARFGSGVTVDGRKVPLKQWTLVGQVAVVLHPERERDRPGGLEIRFHTVRTDDGSEYPLSAVATGTAGDTKKRNVGVIAGGAVLGAILGKKQGDTDEALVGAAAGAAVGAGIVRALPGKHLDLPEGTAMTVNLTDDARLPARPGE